MLIIEERGITLNQLAAFDTGIQVHVEDLTVHIIGRERRDIQERWAELLPSYQTLAGSVGSLPRLVRGRASR